MNIRIACMAALLLSLSSCGGSGSGKDSVVFDIDFSADTAWFHGQSDYTGTTQPEDVIFEARDLPAPFTGQGLYAAGRNESDDLFLYIKRRFTGLEPNRDYDLGFELVFLTNAPMGCSGAGGAPGESVYVKAGADAVQPLTVQTGDTFAFNLDKGNQASTGVDALNLGNVAGTNPNCNVLAFEEKTLRSSAPLQARTDSSGGLWVFFGTDSGFESTTEIYYRRAEIMLDPA